VYPKITVCKLFLNHFRLICLDHYMKTK
jgi:hypothetical protein